MRFEPGLLQRVVHRPNVRCHLAVAATALFDGRTKI